MTSFSIRKWARSGLENVVRGARTEEWVLGKWAMRKTLDEGTVRGKITEAEAISIQGHELPDMAIGYM